MEAGMNQTVVTGIIAGGAGAVAAFVLVRAAFRNTDKGSASSSELIKQLFREELSKAENQNNNLPVESLKTDILNIFDDFMANQLVNKMPVLNMFIDEKLIAEIRVVFHEEMELRLPTLLQQHFHKEENFAFMNEMIDRVITSQRNKMNRQFMLIGLSGCLIGGLTGWIVSLIT